MPYPIKKLGEILDKTKFTIGKIKKKEYLYKGDFPIIDQGKKLIGGYSNYKEELYNGKLPVLVYGDHTNIVKYINFRFIGGADGIKILPFKDNYNVKYCFYLISFFKPETQGYRRHFSLLKEINFPIPPLPTQKKIVSKIDKLFEKIDKSIEFTQKQIENIDELNKSILEGIYTGNNFQQIELGDKKYIEIIDGDRGKNYPKKSEFTEKGYCLFLNTSNVRKGFFKFDKLDFITEEKYNILGKGKAFKNDIILTTRGTIGNTALVENNFPYDFIRINSGMVVLRVNFELFFPKYLIHFINSSNFNNQKNNLVSGSAQPQLPIGVMKQIKIPLPPLEKQKEIVAYLDQIFEKNKKLKESYENKLKDLKEMKQSILKEAFENKKFVK